MQQRSGFADGAIELDLDGHVNVFLVGQVELVLVGPLPQRDEPVSNGGSIGSGYDLLSAEHRHVRQRTHQVFTQQLSVERE